MELSRSSPFKESCTDVERMALHCAEVERQAGLQEGGRAAERQRVQAAVDALERQIAQGNRNLAVLPEDRLPGVIEQVQAWEAERADLVRELARHDAAADLRADYAVHVAAALERGRHLEETIRTAPPNDVRDALAGLVERVILYFDYGPPQRNGYRSSILTSLEVQMREKAAGLLGQELRRSARSTA
jgi:hypothetical protein